MDIHYTHLLSCSSSGDHSFKLDYINDNTSKTNSKSISKLDAQNQSAGKYIDKNNNIINLVEKNLRNDSYNTEFTTLGNGVKIKKVKITSTIIPKKNEVKNENIIFNDNKKLLIIKKPINRSFMTKITIKARKNNRKMHKYNQNNYFRFSSMQKMSNKVRNFQNFKKNVKGKLLLFQKNNSEKNIMKKNHKNILKDTNTKKINYLRNIIKKRSMSSYSNLKSRKLSSGNQKIKKTIYDNSEFFNELKQLKNALQNENSIFTNNTNNTNNDYSYHLMYPRNPSPLLEEYLSCSSLLFPSTSSNNKYEIKSKKIYEKNYSKEKNDSECISIKPKYIIPNVRNNNLNLLQIKNKRAMSSYTKRSKFEMNSINRLTSNNKNYDDRWGNYLNNNGLNNVSDTIGGKNNTSNYFFIEKYFSDDNVNENFSDNRVKVAKLK